MALRTGLGGMLAALAVMVGACSPATAEGPFPPDLVDDVAAAEGFQADALEDEVVTTDELGAAAGNVEACLVAEGVQPDEFAFEAGDIRVRFAGASESAVVDAEAAFGTCFEQEYALLASVFDWQHRPTAEEAADDEAQMLSCLAEEGHPVDDLDEAFREGFDREAFRTCMAAWDARVWAELEANG